MSGTPPVIPTALQQYNSYVVDPTWQTKFSIIWASVVGGAVLVSLPHFARAVRSRRAFTGLFGVWEDFNAQGHYDAIKDGVPHEKPVARGGRRIASALRTVGSVFLWSLPGLELCLGQILLIAAYLAIVLVCIIKDAPLMSNPNRAGFIALAQLPVVFLFATKNSVLSLLLGPGHGYEKLNYIHRWSGRAMFICGLVHGALWIRNHLEYDLAILGPQKETSGVAAFALLCVIVISSLKPVRKWFWQFFFVVHVLSFVAFFVTICYHTIYASPWIFPPLALYALDVLMRMFRYRIKDATLNAVDKQMTIIRVNDCDGGWTAGQHVRLRVFFSGRVFESHPLTILNAPSSTSCLSSPGGILLGARVRGDWSRALNTYATAESERTTPCCDDDGQTPLPAGAQVQVMLDGPYGGCAVDLGRHESVLLVAGGSGATFTLGLLDDIVGRCVRLGRRGGERTRRIEFAWCVRSFGSIEWFAPMLMEIATATARSATLDLHISIFVTCLCNPEAVPPIPNSEVTVRRPDVALLLNSLVSPGHEAADVEASSGVVKSSADVQTAAAGSELEDEKSEVTWVGTGGGVGVCASGPETLTREAHNAVARLGLVRGVELGGVALHTELFSL